MNSEVVGTCALCGSETILKLSHIIPKFVMRHLKETSIGKIRSIGNPNQVVQDSEKHYLLCGCCEKQFSVAETLFSKQLFRPYLDGEKKEFVYKEWLHYFITSVSWRNIYLDITNFIKEGEIAFEDLQILIDSTVIMQDYLMGRRNDIGIIENHIFFFDDIKEAYKEFADLGPHVYFKRSQGGYTFYNSEKQTFATLSNLLGIILITLYKKGTEEYWENTKIHNGEGSIKAEKQIIHSICGQEFLFMLKDAEKAKTELSKKQSIGILERVKKDPLRFANSRVYNEMLKDKKIIE